MHRGGHLVPVVERDTRWARPDRAVSMTPGAVQTPLLMLAAPSEICPSCAQPLLDREALLHLQRVERDAERALTVAAKARAVLMTGPLRRKLRQHRQALSTCRQARADQQTADLAAWQATNTDMRPTEAWDGIP